MKKSLTNNTLVMGSKPENTFLSYLTVLFFSQKPNCRASVSRAHHRHPATSPIHALSHQHIGISRNPLVVLHQPRNSGQNSQLLGFTRDVLKLILPLTTIPLIQLFITKIRLLFVPFHAGCIRKSICSTLVRTPSRVIGIRASFRQVDTLLYLLANTSGIQYVICQLIIGFNSRCFSTE